jgi:serine phosphatase RsbU (regulator of sigma subunit)
MKKRSCHALYRRVIRSEDASGTLFTEDQLHTTVTRYAGLPAQEFFDRVISDVHQFSERKSFDDDVCVVGMEVQHTG